MAKYNIVHACGHRVEAQLLGPIDGRTATIAAMQSGDCPACRAAAAQVESAAAGLPALTGSDKQIAWATDIRSKMLADETVKRYRDNLSKMREQVAANPAAAPVLAAIEAVLAKLDTETSARWWIDNEGRAALLLTDAHRAAAKAAR